MSTNNPHHETTVAFIGLGIMGNPMSVNLQRAGFAVRGYNPPPARTDALVEAGGTAAESVAAAVDGADIVCVMVPDSPDVQDVLLGDDGVFAHAAPGTLVIDFSTIRPDVTSDLAKTAQEKGFRLIDAPVSGGEAGAKSAKLSIMVGGADADFAQAQPVLNAVGATIVHVGGNGAGQTVKAANQLIVAGNIELLAEAVVFLQAHGVDLDAALDVLGGGLAGSAVLDQKRANVTSNTFDPGFRIDLHHKDMGIVTAAAREAGVALPLGAVVAQLVASARACGDGKLDHSALLRGVRRLSGQSPDGQEVAS
ncbi:2-hydroxy-3-oxopropionate reductase [Flexivirga aerilata]